LLAELHQQSRNTNVGSPSYFAAAVHTALGEPDLALQFLEKAYANREVEMYWLKVVPIFDPLRKDPRFQLILKKVGLD
jgi:hypothetical protein